MARVRKVRLDELEAPLVEPFETSFGVERRRRFLVVALEDDTGETGLGECVAARDPLYSGESVATARWMLQTYLIPRLLREELPTPEAFFAQARPLREHLMAKAAVEIALWDLHARRAGTSVARALGGTRSRVEVGVSVGIQPTVPQLVRRVGQYLDDGYRRIKVKVKPGWDREPVGALRREYPDLRLWADANQAYPPSAAREVAAWATEFQVEQLEQPFPERALSAHAEIARGAPFKVCLDESITSAEALDEALERHALTSLNVKPGRVGGLATGRAMGRRAAEAGFPAWVGGMLETGIGRSFNVALASTPPFVFPGDLSASDRYYREEFVDPAFELGPGSTLRVPTGRGLGVEVVERVYRKFLRRRREFRRSA